MRWLTPTALCLVTAILQVGAVPTLFHDPYAAPVLPLTVVAAWGATRGGAETMPGLLGAAIVLGVSSQERAGWFLLAMLPTAALLLLSEPSPNRERPPAAFIAAGAATVGAFAYAGTLALAAGALGELPAASWSMLTAALWTGGAAMVLVIPLLPLKPRPKGLFE